MALQRQTHFELIPQSLDFSNDLPLHKRFHEVRSALISAKQGEFDQRILEYVRLEHISNFQFNAKKCEGDEWLPFFAFWKAHGAPGLNGHQPNWTTPHVMVTRVGHLRKTFIFPSGNMVFFGLLWDYIGRLGLDYLQNHQHGPHLSLADATAETDNIVAYWKARCGRRQKIPQGVSTTMPSEAHPLNKRKGTPSLHVASQAGTERPHKLLKLNVRGELSSDENSQDISVTTTSPAIRTKTSATVASLSTEAESSGHESKSKNESEKDLTSSGTPGPGKKGKRGSFFGKTATPGTSFQSKPPGSNESGVIPEPLSCSRSEVLIEKLTPETSTDATKATPVKKKTSFFGKAITPSGKNATPIDTDKEEPLGEAITVLGEEANPIEINKELAPHEKWLYASTGTDPATRKSRFLFGKATTYSGDETWSEDDGVASINKALSSVTKANSAREPSPSIVYPSSSHVGASTYGKKAPRKTVSFTEDIVSPKSSRYRNKESSGSNASSSKGRKGSPGANGASSSIQMFSSRGRATRFSFRHSGYGSSAIPSVDGASSTPDPLTDPLSSSSPSPPSSPNDKGDNINESQPSQPNFIPAVFHAPLPWTKAGLLVFIANNFAHDFASKAFKAFNDANTLIDNITTFLSLPTAEQEAKFACVLHELAMWKAYHKLEIEKVEYDETFMMDNMVQRLKDNEAEDDVIMPIEELQDAARRGWLKRHVEVIGNGVNDVVGVEGDGEQESEVY